MSTLSKSYSRQGYSLFFCGVWSEGDCRDMARWLGRAYSSFLIMRESEVDKISVWYDRNELRRMEEIIRKKAVEGSGWFDLVLEDFYKQWNILLPYINREKSISSLGELKDYYDTWVRWWSPMVILYEVPNIEGVEKALKGRALRARKETQDFSDGGGEVVTDFFKQHYPQYSDMRGLMTIAEMMVLREREFTEAELSEINAWSKGWALVNDDVVAIEDLDKQLDVRDWQLENMEADTDVRKIQGQIAWTGRARGKVKLVVEGGHIEEFKEGEVLVTEMTTPDFVLAMKKAVAIVTDEGGVTCHAAIVARELKKPCIIGTKIATQVLKDGDEVEVDADEGVVRK